MIITPKLGYKQSMSGSYIDRADIQLLSSYLVEILICISSRARTPLQHSQKVRSVENICMYMRCMKRKAVFSGFVLVDFKRHMLLTGGSFGSTCTVCW